MALQIFLSGGAGNTNPNFSLGGVRSSTQVVDAVDNNLYDDITRKEALIGKTEYRCFYIYNSHASLPVHGATFYIDQYPTITTLTVGFDPAGSGNGTTSGVAQIIPLEDTTPTGVTFEDAGQYKVKLPLPTLKAQQSTAVWIKRIAEAGSSGPLTLGLTVTGDESAMTVGPGYQEFHGDDGLNLRGERTGLIPSTRPFTIGVARIGFSQIE